MFDASSTENQIEMQNGSCILLLVEKQQGGIKR